MKLGNDHQQHCTTVYTCAGAKKKHSDAHYRFLATFRFLPLTELVGLVKVGASIHRPTHG